MVPSRIFGNKSLKPDIRTTDSNPVANNGNDTSTYIILWCYRVSPPRDTQKKEILCVSSSLFLLLVIFNHAAHLIHPDNKVCLPTYSNHHPHHTLLHHSFGSSSWTRRLGSPTRTPRLIMSRTLLALLSLSSEMPSGPKTRTSLLA